MLRVLCCVQGAAGAGILVGGSTPYPHTPSDGTKGYDRDGRETDGECSRVEVGGDGRRGGV